MATIILGALLSNPAFVGKDAPPVPGYVSNLSELDQDQIVAWAYQFARAIKGGG